MILKACIEKLTLGKHLDKEECQQVVDELLSIDANPLQVAAFLVLLRAKTETATELSAIVKALQQKMVSVVTPHKVLDIVGTGGDGANTVNISTGSAILAAACGLKVAKHGNRAASSLSGSADVLEALGVAIELTPEKISDCIDEVGIGFCYSPLFHPAAKELRALRKQLNIPTTFNLLGPLLNPAHASHLIMGVMNESLLPIMAAVLKELGCDRSLVVHGGGLDEISCVGKARIIEVAGNNEEETVIDPIALGFSLCTVADLRGGDAKMNANLLRETFNGKPGAIADTLILNAAVALYIAGKYPSIDAAIPFVKDTLASGAALRLLTQWIEYTHD